MRRFTLLFIILMLALGLTAQPISEQEAQQKAQRFLQGKNIVSSGKTTNNIRRSAKQNPYKHIYLFNVENNGGYVIVAGDSRAREILGYAEEGNLDYSQMPENMKWWLGNYDKEIASIPASASAVRTRAESKPDVAPMMSFSWSQNAPYNAYCPQGCVSGCVPTAMAQMMAYHKYPTSLPALSAYTCTNGIQMPELPANNMNYNDLTGNNAAILVRYCGQAIQANYDRTSTGAPGAKIPTTLISKFGFDKTAHNVYRDAQSAAEWDDVLYQELSNGRPFILSGQVNYDVNNGHTFICHGYSNGYYAVNWGWGGQQNGWFAMSALGTTAGDYSTDLYACIGIRPDAGGTLDYPYFSLCSFNTTSSRQITRYSSNSDFTNVRISWRVRNSLPEGGEYQIAIALFKPDGNVNALVTYANLTLLPENSSNAETAFTIPSSNGDGTYKITLIYKKPSESSWKVCQGFNWRFVQAVISGNTLTLTDYPTYDQPYATGPYPTIPIILDNPDDPDDPDNPDNPDYPDPVYPEANASIDYPSQKFKYEGEDLYLSLEWNSITSLVQSQLNLTPTAFSNYYWADCFEDEDYEEVAEEDAAYVTPFAFNYNRNGKYGRNIYDMLIFNLGNDIYGTGGKAPAKGDAEPEYEYIAIAGFYPNLNGRQNHGISFEMSGYDVEELMEDQESPITFTRWLRFAAKYDEQGKVEAPYHYIWMKLPIEISWGEQTGIATVEAPGQKGIYYNLNGQKVGEFNGESPDKPLRKGIYIYNGKKIVVK